MAAPTYNVDAVTNLVTPNSSIFNRNASGIVTSSTPIVAASPIFEVTTQFINFSIIRQDIIIPNGTFTDPNVTTSAPNGTFAGNATHNRILVNGWATHTVTLQPSSNILASSIRAPQTFLAFGSASGTSGNGMYSTGLGYVNTFQAGYLQVPATVSSAPVNGFAQFTFPIFLRTNRWNAVGVLDPINYIILEVAREVKNRYIPQFREDLLFV